MPSLFQGLLIAGSAANFATGQITGSYPVFPTNAPNPNGPGKDLKNYPQCAQACGNTYFPVAQCPRPPSPPDPTCDCGPVNRGIISPCEAQTCNDADFEKSQELSQDICGPVYVANASLSSAASAAIASATSVALAAVATTNVLDIGEFPACTQGCFPAAIKASGCRGQDDRECVCHCSLFVDLLAPCEFSTCSSEELSLISYLSNALCQPVGGQLPKTLEACRGNVTAASGSGIIGMGTPATPTGAISPSITPFTGAATTVMPGLTVWGVLGCVLALIG